MALSQRLQLRQSQALVMTPQLMQAIKLLQLSNLDLVAYVEAELERNPLLDRNNAAEGEAPVAAGNGAQSEDKSAQERAESGKPGEPEPTAIEKERADKVLDDTSPDDSAPGASAHLRRPGRLFGMGRNRFRRPGRRRLQSRSVCLRRDHACRLAA